MKQWTWAVGIFAGICLCSAAVAQTACLLKAQDCVTLQSAKYAELLKSAQNLPKGASFERQAQAMLTYNAIEDTQIQANKVCRGKRKVDLAGFKQLYVLRKNSEKRALMVKGDDQCTWIKVN